MVTYGRPANEFSYPSTCQGQQGILLIRARVYLEFTDLDIQLNRTAFRLADIRQSLEVLYNPCKKVFKLLG